MKRFLATFALAVSIAIFSSGCMVSIIGSDSGNNSNDKPTTISYGQLFPFDKLNKTWHFSDSAVSVLTISVTDTISDGYDHYYKLAFVESKTGISEEDWFVLKNGAILYSQSLSSGFIEFVPASLNGSNGSFTSGSQTISYVCRGVQTIGTKNYSRTLELSYTTPVLHGFDQVTLADSVGIVSLVDNSGRWPVAYYLDSISGK